METGVAAAKEKMDSTDEDESSDSDSDSDSDSGDDDSGDDSDGYGEAGLSWDAVLADVRGSGGAGAEKKGKEAEKNVPAGGPRERARKGPGRGVFDRDAAKAKNRGSSAGGKKNPRGTVSFMKETKPTGRDRSKGAGKARLAEKKAKREVEV